MVISSKADIYSRDDLLYVATLALTRRGYTFETDQVHTLPDAVDSETLGVTVLRAVDAYEANVPDIGDPVSTPPPCFGRLASRAFDSLNEAPNWSECR